MKARTMIAAVLLAGVSVSAQEKARPPQGPPGTVTLPLGEYERLMERAEHPPKRPEVPPIPWVLSRAELRVRVDGDAARGALALDGEVFRTGPTKVPLLTGATLIEARLGPRTLPLVTEGETHGAILTGPGAFSVALDVGAPVVTEAGRASLVLPVPAAGSVRLVLDLPGDRADVQVQPGLITRRAASGGRTLLEATLEPGRPVRASWSSREGNANAASAPREARYLAEVKTLVTVGEADVRAAALVELSVLQGAPERFTLRIPEGFEVTGVSGRTLEQSDAQGDVLTLAVREPGQRRHQFLIGLERSTAPGSIDASAPLVFVEGAQRETGEGAVEGAGTLELSAEAGGGARALDVREVNPTLRSFARSPLLAAFRYNRRTGDAPSVALHVSRFPDAAVLAAVAERATVTTLVTTEGRTLTEVALTVRNRAQPFLKVSLPEGSTLLSAEVAGERVKPVRGEDGTRIPLLRPGFRPDGPYAASFVYFRSGEALGKKGEAALVLPRMDVPVNLLEWELFVPDRYRVKDFRGNAIPTAAFGYGTAVVAYTTLNSGVVGGVSGSGGRNYIGTSAAAGGQIAGRVTDASGAVLPGATVTVRGSRGESTATTDANGYFVVSGVAPGPIQVRADLSGFASVQRNGTLPAGASLHIDMAMRIGSAQESVTVTAEAPLIPDFAGNRQRAVEDQAPSQNVFNLQRRVEGLLPVRVDVPRAGASHRFLRPLVVDDETVVRFRYKAR